MSKLFLILGLGLPMLPRLIDLLWDGGQIIYSVRLKAYLLQNPKARKGHSDPYLMDGSDYHGEWRRYFEENEHLQVKDSITLCLGKLLKFWLDIERKVSTLLLVVGGGFLAGYLLLRINA